MMCEDEESEDGLTNGCSETPLSSPPVTSAAITSTCDCSDLLLILRTDSPVVWCYEKEHIENNV